MEQALATIGDRVVNPLAWRAIVANPYQILERSNGLHRQFSRFSSTKSNRGWPFLHIVHYCTLPRLIVSVQEPLREFSVREDPQEGVQLAQYAANSCARSVQIGGIAPLWSNGVHRRHRDRSLPRRGPQ